MSRGIDHLVLCGRDLGAIRGVYRRLGFTLTPPARHPFGTGNSLVQLQGSFLELLTVMDRSVIPESSPEHFSFAAFNRDFLARHEGFSMLVLDSHDARADVEAFAAAGLRTHAPFEFSRKARLPTGDEATVGFSLAFVSTPELPEAGFFTCQQHAPQHFWKPEFQQHANGAVAIREVCLVCARPERLGAFFAGFTGATPRASPDELRFATARGEVVVATPDRFERTFGVEAPDISSGGRLAGYAIAVKDVRALSDKGLMSHGGLLVLPPNLGFGAAIAFVPDAGQ